MSDLEKLYVEAVRESARSLQTWLVWATGASLSILVSAYAPLSEGTRTTLPVPGFLFTVDRDAAELLATTFFFVAGIMAAVALEGLQRAAAQLRNNPDLLNAASLFPTVATLPHKGGRQCVALLPFLLALWAAIAQLVNAGAGLAEWVFLAFSMALLGVPYFVLALEIGRPMTLQAVRTSETLHSNSSAMAS